MKRIITLILSISLRLLLLLSIIAGLSYFLLASSAGLRLVAHLTQKMLPGHLEIANSRGRLASSFVLKDVHYRYEGTEVTVQYAQISWNLAAIFSRVIPVYHFTVQGVKIVLHDTGKPSSQLTINDLTQSVAWLKYFNIQQVNITDLSYRQNEQTAHIDAAIILPNKEGMNSLTIKSNMGELNGYYRFHCIPGKSLEWNADLVGSHIDPEKLLPNVSGNLNMSLVTDGIWSAQTHAANLQIKELKGQLRQFPLSGFGAFHYADGQLTIANSQFTIANAVSQISGSLQKTWNLQWSLNVPQINALIPTSYGSIVSEGKLTGTKENPALVAKFTAQQLKIADLKMDSITGTIDSNLQKPMSARLSLLGKNLTISDNVIPALSVEIKAREEGAQIRSDIRILLSQANQLQGTLNLPAFTHWDDVRQALDGKLKVNFTDLNQFILIPYTKNLRGTIQGTIDLQGALNKPKLIADLNLNNGHLEIPKLGISLNAISAHTESDLYQPINITGSFNSGDGKGNIQGSIDIYKAELPMEFNIKGTDLVFANLHDYKIHITPDLTISYANNDLGIKGTVEIPYAEITPQQFNNVVSLPSEIVYVDENETTPTLPTNLSLQLQLNLGKDIHIAYQNLDAQLAGNILITERPGSVATGAGELHTINGKYQAYGKMLDIQNGRIVYTGNLLTNPGLDIQAVKKVQTVSLAGSSETTGSSANSLQPVYTGSGSILVGVTVKGTVKKPQVSLYSDQTLSQEDILSYLLFGYPRSQVTGASSLALLNSLASNMNTSGGHNIGAVTGNVQKFLGLTELNVGNTEVFDPNKNTISPTTTVSIGKKIGKRLYIHYSVGVFDPVQILNLRYQINKHFSVQSETSTIDTGADLLYEIERD